MTVSLTCVRQDHHDYHQRVDSRHSHELNKLTYWGSLLCGPQTLPRNINFKHFAERVPSACTQHTRLRSATLGKFRIAAFPRAFNEPSRKLPRNQTPLSVHVLWLAEIFKLPLLDQSSQLNSGFQNDYPTVHSMDALQNRFCSVCRPEVLVVRGLGALDYLHLHGY